MSEGCRNLAIFTSKTSSTCFARLILLVVNVTKGPGPTVSFDDNFFVAEEFDDTPAATCLLQGVRHSPLGTDELLGHLQLHPCADPIPVIVHLLQSARSATLLHANPISIHHGFHSLNSCISKCLHCYIFKFLHCH